MNYIFWLYIFFSGQTECKYERVGIFSTADSLHIVSNTLNYHLKFERTAQVNQFMVYSQNHPDSLFAIQDYVGDEGIIIFISEIKPKKTVVLSGKCGISKSLSNQ